MDTPDNIPMSSKVSDVSAQRKAGTSSLARKPGSRPVSPHFVARLFQATRRWFLANTFAPRFLSGPWSHPIFGYFVAVLLQVVAVAVIALLVQVYPTFRFIEAPLILVVLFIALNWGVGPSVIATIAGALLLTFFILPPAFSLLVAQSENVIGVCLYLVVGLVISVLAGQTARARRHAETLLAHQETIFETVPDIVTIHSQEHFLAEISIVLASSLDYQTTLTNIARLVVPQLADWFTVDLVDASGNFELIEIKHTDPQKVRWAKELREKYPVDPRSPTGAPKVIRTGQSELYPYITDEMLVASARNDEELALVRQIGLTSVMIVPLVARGKTIGVVTFVYAESARRYDGRDLALAEEVGRRAGVALDNARLYREAEQARDQLDIILQGVADGIIVYNTNSQIIYANEAAAQLTGYASVQAMLETPPLSIVAKYETIDEQGHPFPRSQLTHRRVFAGEREAEATIGYRDISSGQAERWSFVKSRPMFDAHGDVAFVITIVHDLTERVLAERRKDEFISMASHELKTPITSLKGFTHILQRRLAKQGDEQGLHFLARMDAQLDKLNKLISDLLDTSRMQAGKLDLQLAPFDLDALVDETVENVQATTSTHQILIEERAGAQVLGDKDRLGQVLINLLTNAIKYSPQADKVIVRASKDQEQAIVSVQDFGIGIAEAHHEKIFERFYQITDPAERTYAGLGIGLYISHEIVERHHGRMWVESSKGAGATFYIALPLFKEE